MKISLNWVKEFIDLPKNLTAEKIAYDLTMSTVEVESIEKQADNFIQMVVGKVKEIKKHPNADKLQLAMTDIGNGEIKQIVCGGTNLYEGMLVLVALPGAKVKWHGEGELITLKKAKIRGEESFGMICAGEEVGLAEFSGQDGEIIDLSFVKSKPGTTIAEALNLNDIILDIDNKSLTNRPDLWGHYGMARELAAIYKLPLKQIDHKQIKTNNIKDEIKIDIETQACRRYLSVVIDNVKIGPSPEWLKNKLRSVGQKSINNIVDMTNFVMYEIGQPTHAFDFVNLKDKQIVVRQAKEGEKLVTLDGESRKLNKQDMIISTDNKPIALAGIMGGADSGISDKTNKIVLESASFSAIDVRYSSKRLNLRTESSIRFEKGIDVKRAEIAMYRMIDLLSQLQSDVKVGKIVDMQNIPDKQVIIEVSLDFLNNRLGQKLQSDEIINILEALEFKVKFKDNMFVIFVPSHRATGDVSLPEDIVEEIARIKGYDNFSFVPPKVELISAVWQEDKVLLKKIKEFFSFTMGMNEVFNYPWCLSDVFTLLNENKKKKVVISNPPAENQNILQNSLLPNIIGNVEENIKNFKEFAIYEISRVFDFEKENEFNGDDIEILPRQRKFLSGALVGAEKESVFFELKGIIESFIDFFHSEVILCKQKIDIYDNDYTLVLKSKDKEVIGQFGFLNENINNKFNFNNLSVCLFEIDVKKFIKSINKQIIYNSLPQFPEVTRDLSILVDNDISWQDIKDNIEIKNFVKGVEFFDFYKGDKIPKDKKSVSFKVILGADKTLTTKEIDKEIENILQNLQKNIGGSLRKI